MDKKTIQQIAEAIKEIMSQQNEELTTTNERNNPSPFANLSDVLFYSGDKWRTLVKEYQGFSDDYLTMEFFLLFIQRARPFGYFKYHNSFTLKFDARPLKKYRDSDDDNAPPPKPKILFRFNKEGRLAPTKDKGVIGAATIPFDLFLDWDLDDRKKLISSFNRFYGIATGQLTLQDYFPNIPALNSNQTKEQQQGATND